MNNNYHIEEDNYENFSEYFKETFAKDIIKKENNDALAAFLELLIK